MRCYLTAISRDSSLDKYTNTWSLFGIVEQVNVGEEELPAQFPFHVHLYFQGTDDEIGSEFEARFVVEDDRGQEVSESSNFQFTLESDRMRARIRGLAVRERGLHYVYAEWRSAGNGQWERAVEPWPLEFALREEG